ncbi:MAG: NAD(P)-dependent glycerol-3-phosphate dehydrogenase [Actinobacteria bacterium]|nr:NAD(P)-dependent glycerol-3-phosphate dehydrogenase [Actinomycetota bacterium]
MCVVGAGSWGTTVASLVAHNAETTLWARRDDLVDEINSRHTNSAYLPSATLPDTLRASSDLDALIAAADVVAMAVPSQGFRDVAARVATSIGATTPVVSLSKGLERSTLMRMSQVLEESMPGRPVAVLSGPNLAREILAGQPAASVIACADDTVATTLQQLFSRPTFRLYTNPDVVGCEIGGVVKNVIAIAAGIAQGFGFGDNTKATLVTRGLAEMTRLGVAMGANPLTFAGLAGMGDIMATCASMQSRNTQVGVRLGKGESIADIVASMNMVAEGVKSSAVVVDLARKLGVEMPIAEQVARVCDGTQSAADALRALMSRSSRSEFD